MIFTKDIETTLLLSRAYLGHKITKTNTKLLKFIFSIIGKISIIDIEYTIYQLKKVIFLLHDLTNTTSIFLMIGGNNIKQTKMVKVILNRYISGSLTNNIETIYSAVISLNQPMSLSSLRESRSLMIPTISVVDTNESIDNIDYLVISSNDSTEIVEMYQNVFTDSIKSSIRNQKLTFKYHYLLSD